MLFLLFARLVDDCVAAVALSLARQRAALAESTVVLSRVPSVAEAHERFGRSRARNLETLGLLELRPAVAMRRNDSFATARELS
jgi:hypothetical protein